MSKAATIRTVQARPFVEQLADQLLYFLKDHSSSKVRNLQVYHSERNVADTQGSRSSKREANADISGCSSSVAFLENKFSCSAMHPSSLI